MPLPGATGLRRLPLRCGSANSRFIVRIGVLIPVRIHFSSGPNRLLAFLGQGILYSCEREDVCQDSVCQLLDGFYAPS
jgi:hypothetical protein